MILIVTLRSRCDLGANLYPSGRSFAFGSLYFRTSPYQVEKMAKSIMPGLSFVSEGRFGKQ